MIRREFVKLTTGSLIARRRRGGLDQQRRWTHAPGRRLDADLQSVTAGETIKVTTGSASSHTHVLTFVKIA